SGFLRLRSAGQLWRAEPAGNGFYRLKTRFRGDNECLEGNNGSAGAFMDKCQNVSGQFWEVVAVD
ncbi:MAG: carbohydrate-binding protein, partial [Cyanobacteria bacterium J06649_4]